MIASSNTSLTNDKKALYFLHPMQLDAIKYVIDCSMNDSQAAREVLAERFKKLDLSKGALRKTCLYIRDEAPIIVHFKASLFPLFLKDTHYKNQVLIFMYRVLMCSLKLELLVALQIWLLVLAGKEKYLVENILISVMHT